MCLVGAGGDMEGGGGELDEPLDENEQELLVDE